MCAKFQQKIINFMVAGARQSFQFFRQIPSFSEIIGLCLNLGIGICITLVVLSNCKKISPQKAILRYPREPP